MSNHFLLFAVLLWFGHVQASDQVSQSAACSDTVVARVNHEDSRGLCVRYYVDQTYESFFNVACASCVATRDRYAEQKKNKSTSQAS